MSQFVFKALPFALVFAEPLFGLLEVINVGRCSEPAKNLSRLVSQRVDRTEKPTERSVVATKPRLELPWLPFFHLLQPGFHQLRQVVGVHRRLPTPASRVF